MYYEEYMKPQLAELSELEKEGGYLDVNNYDYDALFGVEFGMDKKQRIQTFESGLKV